MEVVEAQPLRSQAGRSVRSPGIQGSAGCPDRRHLNGEPVPGQRARAATDPFEEYVSYCRLRLDGDPPVWLTTLSEEVAQLGYAGSHQSVTRAIRTRSRRPRCEAYRQAAVKAPDCVMPVASVVSDERSAPACAWLNP
jgi:hypothetical protein